MTRRDRRKHEEAGWLSRLENNRRKEENRERGRGRVESRPGWDNQILDEVACVDPLKRRERCIRGGKEGEDRGEPSL